MTIGIWSWTAAASAPQLEYYPLKTGHWWEYRTNDGRTHRTEVKKKKMFQGREAFVVHAWGTESYMSLENQDIMVAMPRYGMEYTRLFVGPPQDGLSWSFLQFGVISEHRWEAVPCPRVPAGQFSDCFRDVQTNAPSTSYSIYAPGVGIIYTVNRDQITELVSTNLLQRRHR